MSNTEKNKFEIYADDFEGNESSLFLTEMNRGKKYTVRSKLLFFKEVYDWIVTHIAVITPNTPLIDLEYYYDTDSLKLINKLIETFDTGISKVKIEEISLDELSNAMPKPVFDKVMHHVKSRIEEQENPSFRMTMRSNAVSYTHLAERSFIFRSGCIGGGNCDSKFPGRDGSGTSPCERGKDVSKRQYVRWCERSKFLA